MCRPSAVQLGGCTCCSRHRVNQGVECPNAIWLYGTTATESAVGYVGYKSAAYVARTILGAGLLYVVVRA
jgi:hypothetical protein